MPYIPAPTASAPPAPPTQPSRPAPPAQAAQSIRPLRISRPAGCPDYTRYPISDKPWRWWNATHEERVHWGLETDIFKDQVAKQKEAAAREAEDKASRERVQRMLIFFRYMNRTMCGKKEGWIEATLRLQKLEEGDNARAWEKGMREGKRYEELVKGRQHYLSDAIREDLRVALEEKVHVKDDGVMVKEGSPKRLWAEVEEGDDEDRVVKKGKRKEVRWNGCVPEEVDVEMDGA